MSNTFTAQELADFYQKVADGGEIDYTLIHKDCFGHPENGPHMGCNADEWRIKPTKKVIDLSVLIRGIDCQFSDEPDFLQTNTGIATLKNVGRGPSYYASNSPNQYLYCQPRMNHIHAWQGGECPLPEGFRVRVWLRGNKNPTICVALDWAMKNNPSRDIIAFEVLGLADGYVMPYGGE